MLNLEVGGDPFAAGLQKEHKPSIFHARNPRSFGNAAFQLGFSSCCSAAPAPMLGPQGAAGAFDPLQIHLKSCGFFPLATVQLELGLDRSCTRCTDLPVAQGGFEFSSGHAGKQGAGSSGNLYSSVRVGAVGRMWPLHSNAERALPSACCQPSPCFSRHDSHPSGLCAAPLALGRLDARVVQGASPGGFMVM